MKTRRIIIAVLFLLCFTVLCACVPEEQTHTITFVNHDDSVLLELEVKDGEIPQYTLEDPSREATAQYSYTFLGWDKKIEPATEDLTYKAVYSETVNKYTVTFVDEDGTVLETKEYEYGRTPGYSGKTPEKEATDENTYGFAGWDKELVAVTGDATYKAVYTSSKNSYKVTFLDLEGNLLYEVMVEYGTAPVYGGEIPALQGNDQYSYVFLGWDKELAAVTGEATYRPRFDQVVNKYLITFKDEAGNTLQSTEVEYGTLPVFEGTLPLPNDTAEFDYSGSWDKEIVSVTGEATYTYLVTKSDRYYTVSFKVGDRVLAEGSYKFGETPSFDRVPYKASTEEYVYTFAGWDNELKAVEADVTYTAVFTETPNTFGVVISHLDLDGFVVSEAHKAELTEEKLYTYTAPAVEGKTPSHSYLNYHYQGDKLLINVYYSDLATWDGSSVSTEFVGEGSEANPYLISSGADLALLRDRVNGGETYAGKYFKMTKSIDLGSVSLMIGNEVPGTWANLPTKGFAGTFDGNNCAILNFKLAESSYGELNGLFKTILPSSKVANLSVYGQMSQVIRGSAVIAGRNAGTIENCTNYVTISPEAGATIGQNHRYTGAIASLNYGNIISCVNYATISGEQYASGIVAKIYEGTVENCINYAEIIGKGFKPAGICGEAAAGTISNCTNYGNVSGTQYAAGIVALNSAVLSNCNNYGTVTQTGSETAGGIVGSSTAAISNCNNYGNVTGLNKWVGGIVGTTTSTVSGCNNYGDIKTTGNYESVGGIAGKATAAVTNCVNNGDVNGYHYVAGIVGYPTATVSDCVNYGDVSGRQWIGGIAGQSGADIANCVNNGNVTGTADFVGGIVGASSGTVRTIKDCTNNGAVKGVNYIGGIDGRPYAGDLTLDGCVNNGTVTASSSYAGGIVGRTNVAKALLINCQSNGAVSATYPGAFVGIDKATDTSGCTIEDSCTSTLENMFKVGYDELTGYPGGGVTTDFVDTDKLDILSGGFYDAEGSIKTYYVNNVGIIKNLTFAEGEFSTLVTLGTGVKAGVIFGYSKTDAGESYYRVSFADSKSLVYIDKVVDGTVTTLASQFVASPNVAGEYEFHIVIEDGKAYCYFWGERLWAIIDMELTGTGVGFYSDSLGSEFRSYSVTEGVTHTTTDTLIFGHSYMDFWSSYKADLSNVAEEYDIGEYLNIGNGGSRANHWLALKDCVAAYEADRLIYMIGINDISGSRAPETIVAEIEELLAYLKELNPDLEVILLAVNHCPSKTAKAAEISATNDLMEALCAENNWIYFADIEYAFCDDGVNPTASWFTSDGLHLAAKAYTDKIVPAIAEGLDFFAQQKITKYTIKFVDEQGNLLFEQQLPYGEMPVFGGTLPTIPDNTDYCTYTGGWDKEIKAASADATYTYVITATYEKYTVKFVDEDGTLLYETQVEWGQTPIYNGVQPEKASTSEYVYQFAGWTPALEAITKEMTYQATFNAIETPYDVIIYHLNLDGTKAADDHTAELTEEKLYSYEAPTVEGKQASHEYLNYRFEGKKVLITIYYSDVDTWDGTSVSTEFAGSGTAADPYLISSGADLALLRANVNAGETYAGSYFKMTKSIDLNSASLMIGTSDVVSFAGIFDGNNCSLLNIKTKETQTGQYAGLFKYLLAGGKICNLSTYGAYNQTIKMNGVIVARNHGIIENVTNYVSITVPSGTTPAELHRYTGAIASVNYGNIISCVNYGEISGEEYPSGIVARMYAGSTVENCINYGTITGKGFRTAGIVGMADAGTVTGCVNFGDVTTGATSNETAVGGIVGRSAAVVKDCVNYGTISSTASKLYVGGIVGYVAGGSISNCVNYGTAKGYDYVGGIAGLSIAIISDCENHGTISGRQWIGGVAGNSRNNIINCVNQGSVTGTADFIGGIVGASGHTDAKTYIDRTISGCVNNGDIKGVGYIGGIDGRPYAGTVTYNGCVNNGTVTSTLNSTTDNRASAGGIMGRSDVAHGILINCQSNGALSAKKNVGIYIGYNKTSDTTGYTIYDSCSTTLTGNAIGYDATLAAAIPLEGFAYTKTEEEQ